MVKSLVEETQATLFRKPRAKGKGLWLANDT
jgi:hypothetical protein